MKRITALQNEVIYSHYALHLILGWERRSLNAFQRFVQTRAAARLPGDRPQKRHYSSNTLIGFYIQAAVRNAPKKKDALLDDWCGLVNATSLVVTIFTVIEESVTSLLLKGDGRRQSMKAHHP